MKKNPGIVLWVLILGALFLSFAWMNQGGKKDHELPISEFVAGVEDGKITEHVVINGDHVRGEAANGIGYVSYVTEKEELVKVLHEKHVRYEEHEPTNYNGLFMLLKFAIPVVLILIVMRAAKNAGPNGMLKSHVENKATLHEEPTATFADVAGIDEAIEEVRDLVTFLKDPKKLSTLGGRSPKGILLVGPPGTGKTLLARAIAGEAGVPFFVTSGSKFVEMFVGTGAARVRDLFDTARKKRPCVVFIDELDAVGKKRSEFTGFGSHLEADQTLNELLVQMDGFLQTEDVIVIAATNRAEILDPALTRAGRFDRTVSIERPNVKGREAILKVHARDKKVAPGVDYNLIARGTMGLVGADLAKLMNEAALVAAKRGVAAIEAEDIEQAKLRAFMGPERKSVVLTGKIKQILAWHEAGHALVGWFTPESDSPHYVTIVPRGQALGLTVMLPEEDILMLTRNELLARIKMLFGGRAAEKLLLAGDYTTGASNDISRATELAEHMVKRFGMGKDLGPGTFGKEDQNSYFPGTQGDYSEATAVKIDAAKRAILEEGEAIAANLVADKRPKLEALAKLLLEKETIGLEHLTAVFGPRKVAV